MRYPPRITVRGHPVQGGGVPLRKAPLRSRVYPWSTKRPCGPLAFRRATEGSRVLRKGWGVKRGRETLVSLPLLPPPPGGGNSHAMSWRISSVPGGRLSPPAAHRCIGGDKPSAEGKERRALAPKGQLNALDDLVEHLAQLRAAHRCVGNAMVDRLARIIQAARFRLLVRLVEQRTVV